MRQDREPGFDESSPSPKDVIIARHENFAAGVRAEEASQIEGVLAGAERIRLGGDDAGRNAQTDSKVAHCDRNRARRRSAAEDQPPCLPPPIKTNRVDSAQI